jgi:16S rRNA G1207 methylase RsmC
VVDLTSLLLRGFLKAKLQRDPNLKVLELGIGRFAIPGGYLSRYARGTLDAVDVDADCVASSRRVARHNGFDVRVLQSDLFAALPTGARYDLIYWNLPYYRETGYLQRLFADVADHLSPGGELVLGYNSAALPRDHLRAALASHPSLEAAGVRTWRWNRHEIMVVRAAGTREHRIDPVE